MDQEGVEIFRSRKNLQTFRWRYFYYIQEPPNATLTIKIPCIKESVHLVYVLLTSLTSAFRHSCFYPQQE